MGCHTWCYAHILTKQEEWKEEFINSLKQEELDLISDLENGNITDETLDEYAKYTVFDDTRWLNDYNEAVADGDEDLYIKEFGSREKLNEYINSLHLDEDTYTGKEHKEDWISEYQKLSEDFIREFKDKVYWRMISEYQKLSEGFIREFKDKVNWGMISKCQKLSEDFIREFQDKVEEIYINNSWHYKDTEFKKQEVIKTGLYECHDDYFIAYKGIRSDRYSKFNFQNQYLPGQTYESWCDYSFEENSFGLSVWTEEKAKGYCNELVVKVKVKYEDVGRVLHDGGKIRCTKIEILN